MPRSSSESNLSLIEGALEKQKMRWRRLQIVLFGLLGCLGGLTFFLDQTVINWITSHRTKAIRKFAGELSNYGDWPWLMSVALVFLIFAWWKKRKNLFRIVLIMIFASSAAGLTVNLVRGTTGRARPNNRVAEPGWYGTRHDGKWLIGQHKYNSFPSGHSGGAWGFFAVLLFQKKRGAWIAILLAFAVSASRLVVNAHHLSDVYYGAWIGLGFACWAGHWEWIHKLTERAFPPARPLTTH